MRNMNNYLRIPKDSEIITNDTSNQNTIGCNKNEILRMNQDISNIFKIELKEIMEGITI